MPCTIPQYPTKFCHINNPIICFRNNSYIAKNHFSNPRANNSNNNVLPRKENSQPNMGFDKKSLSKLRVKGIVDRIKSLTSKERCEVIITKWEQSNDFDTIYEFNDLIVSLLTVDETELALKLFDDMSSHGLVPDSWTFSLCIRCYCKNKNFDEAERVLNHMLANGLHPNFATIALLIESLSQYGKLTRALSVLDEMGRVGFSPRVLTYNCLLKGLCFVGRVDDALDMLMGMKREDSTKPDVYSYTAVMDGLCKVGRADEAFELLTKALEMGLNPDVVAFNTLFHGYCVEGRPVEGVRVLKLMKERGCVPDSISYNTLLYGLLKWRDIKTALRVYVEISGVGLKVEDKMLNALLIGLCRKVCKGEKVYLGIAKRLFEEMKCDGSVVNASTYDMMIQTLCVGKKTDEASVNLQEMIRMGFSPRTITFNGVIRVLCGEGKATEALFLVVLLYEGGRVPSRICFDLLIHELNQRETLVEACGLYAAALKRGVNPSKKPEQ